jgi:signal peptidase I
LWVITDEEYVYDGTTYKRGDVVTFDPESHGEFKKIVKNQSAAGFVTYADFNSSAAIMNARYDDVSASISASVIKDENDVVIGNIVLNADNVSIKNGNTTTALF